MRSCLTERFTINFANAPIDYCMSVCYLKTGLVKSCYFPRFQILLGTILVKREQLINFEIISIRRTNCNCSCCNSSFNNYLSHFWNKTNMKNHALIQKAIPEKTKIARKYSLKNLKGKKKQEFEVSTWQFHFDNSYWFRYHQHWLFE